MRVAVTARASFPIPVGKSQSKGLTISIWHFVGQAIISLVFPEGASVCLSAAAAEPTVACAVG